MDANLLKGNLDLILLTVIGDSERYGMEIIDEVNDRTNGYFNFKEGSVYPALHRLTVAGWLEATIKPSPRRGMPSRVYTLSKKGKAALLEKQKEFDFFAKTVQSLRTS